MKKSIRIITAVILALCMCAACAFAPVYATAGVPISAQSDDAKMKFGKGVIKAFGFVADSLITGVAKLFPRIDWPTEQEYKSENFMPGSEIIRTEAAENAHWSVGFASESIIPEDIGEVGYVRAGNFHIKEELTYNVMEGDDQCIKAVALSDGSGSGTVIFCSLDAFGISGTNVRNIRAAILKAAADSGIRDIISINVTVTHTHSALDTHGLGAGILNLLGDSIKAGFYRLIGKEYKVSSLNENLMNNLFGKAAKAAVRACQSMQTGSLGFSAFDIADMLYDKQFPLVYDENVNVIKFTPDSESARDIWLVNMGCHPVRMTSYDYVCSDYPEAISRFADSMANADVAFYQGSQLAITKDDSALSYDTDEYERQPDNARKAFFLLNEFGKEIVSRIMHNEPVESFLIEPYLNIAHKEIKIPVTSSLILLISKINMLNNAVISNTGKLNDVKVVTEIGYCELGERLAIALVPGEIDPAIIWGGVYGADKSWNGTDWEFEPFSEMAGGRKLIVYGLTNDQIGYIVPDNDFAHPFASLFEDLIGGSRNKHYEEMISLGKNTASAVTKSFSDLTDEVNSQKFD